MKKESFTLVIERWFEDDKQIIGELVVYDGKYKELLRCKSLELKYRDNKNNISSIYHGTFEGKIRTSPKFGEHIHILNVEGRSFILIHPGNYYHQLEGCILVGDSLRDIDGDGYVDVTNSRKTLNKILDILREGEDNFKIVVTDLIGVDLT